LANYTRYSVETEQALGVKCIEIIDPIADVTDEMLKQRPELNKIDCIVKFNGQLFVEVATNIVSNSINEISSLLLTTNMTTRHQAMV
jgi:hypothetical protein